MNMHKRVLDELLMAELDARGLDLDDFYWHMSGVMPHVYWREIFRGTERRPAIVEQAAKAVAEYLGTNDWPVWASLLDALPTTYELGYYHAMEKRVGGS